MKQSTPYPLPSSRVSGGSGQGFPVVAAPPVADAPPPAYRAGSWTSPGAFAYGTAGNMAEPVHPNHAYMLPGTAATAAPPPPTSVDASYQPPGGHSQNFLRSVALNNGNAANDAANFAAAAPTPTDPTAAAARSAFVSGHRARADQFMQPYAGPNAFEGNRNAVQYSDFLPRQLDAQGKMQDAAVTSANLGNDRDQAFNFAYPGMLKNQTDIGQATAALIPKQGDATIRKTDAEAGAITSRTTDVAGQNKALQIQLGQIQRAHDNLQRQHQQALTQLGKNAGLGSDPLNPPGTPAQPGQQPQGGMNQNQLGSPVKSGTYPGIGNVHLYADGKWRDEKGNVLN